MLDGAKTSRRDPVTSMPSLLVPFDASVDHVMLWVPPQPNACHKIVVLLV
ncbi:hypothetical protein TOL_2116 [Thalassolituus oleivorans MIL-1]|uniref:Uncharacterized protein n=1 Tax=Thalassolituus oleivorans MIL-1 TaxID=1298593 RepID=M5DRI8_9GAMM|nr:hypothetical protein TOL_2116 [Thalassolituus oleivorans MIL-1]